MHTNCFLFLFWHSEQFMYTTCSELVVFMYWTGKLMNNLLSYCGLVDARISASEIEHFCTTYLPCLVHLFRELPLKEEIPGNLKFNKDSLKWSHSRSESSSDWCRKMHCIKKNLEPSRVDTVQDFWSSWASNHVCIYGK